MSLRAGDPLRDEQPQSRGRSHSREAGWGPLKCAPLQSNAGEKQGEIRPEKSPREEVPTPRVGSQEAICP